MLALMMLFTLVINAQMYPDVDTKKNVTFQYFQWTNYSIYGGYILHATNDNDEDIVINVTAQDIATGINYDYTAVIPANSTELVRLGWQEEGYITDPYVEGLKFTCHVSGAVNTTLNVQTIGSPYTSGVPKKKK